MSFTPEILAQWTGGRWTRQPANGVSGFSIDSRKLQPGDMFVALRTEKRDGHDFIEAAAAAGASAALVSREIADSSLPQLVVQDPLKALQELSHRHRLSYQGTVVSVTGSAGKTSTKDLLGLLLGNEQEVLRTDGNFNNHIGAPLTLLRIRPDQHRFAIIEAGLSKPGDLEDLGRIIQPDHTVVTLIAPAHLEGMGSLERIAREKTALSRWARPGGYAVFPASAARYSDLFEHGLVSIVVAPADTPDTPGQRIVRFSTEYSGSETFLRLHTEGRADRVFSAPLLSPGLAQNAALALTLASSLGIPDDQLAARLREWQPSTLRGQILRFPRGMLYLDCYNANPAAVADALSHFEHVAPSEAPRLHILGTMGELGPDSPYWHRITGGRVRLRPGDRLLAVGSQASALLDGARDAGAPGEALSIAEGHDDIREQLRNFRGSVFVKGSRGLALERALEGTPFDPSVFNNPPPRKVDARKHSSTATADQGNRPC
jgi:UDP-N-acetylmuramoyl-tripeptide--D-alanyl-D-alanine ligase